LEEEEGGTNRRVKVKVVSHGSYASVGRVMGGTGGGATAAAAAAAAAPRASTTAAYSILLYIRIITY
jgi:hypothetical protein